RSRVHAIFEDCCCAQLTRFYPSPTACMQTEQTAALTNTPAIVLALVLLGAMAVASVQVAQYVLLAPGTLLPAA
ncbi:hypothetical protein L0O99_18390, partial [Bilophila wadsworthia]|nr:hypothetical protein [Bilophila wadsworthia]